MVRVTVVYSPSSHLTRLLAPENFIQVPCCIAWNNGHLQQCSCAPTRGNCVELSNTEFRGKSSAVLRNTRGIVSWNGYVYRSGSINVSEVKQS